MDVMMDPVFWGEVGLAAAARLAVLAAVVWVARIVLARTPHIPPGTPARVIYATTAPRNRAGETVDSAPPAFVNLKPHAQSLAGTGPRSETHERLMQYLQQRSVERTMS
jgi:hypothetical protein